MTNDQIPMTNVKIGHKIGHWVLVIGHYSSCSLYRLGLFFVFFSITALISRAQEPRMELKYPLGSDSFQHKGVPRGEVSTHEWNDSKVFPGTLRRYYVYVPAQFEAAKS